MDEITAIAYVRRASRALVKIKNCKNMRILEEIMDRHDISAAIKKADPNVVNTKEFALLIAKYIKYKADVQHLLPFIDDADVYLTLAEHLYDHMVYEVHIDEEIDEYLAINKRTLVRNMPRIPPNLLIDEEFVCKLLLLNGRFFEELPPLYQLNKKMVIAAVSNCPHLLVTGIDDSLKCDYDVVVSAINGREFGTHALNFVPKSVFEDKKIMMRVMELDGREYARASHQLKKDEDIIYAALQNANIFHQIPTEDMPTYRTIALYSLTFYPEIIADMPAVYYNDEEFMLEAVSRCWFHLEYAGDEILCNRKVVLAAVKNSGYALKYAPSFYGDLEMVRIAIRTFEPGIHEIIFMKDVPDHIKQDKAITMRLIYLYGSAIIKHVLFWPVSESIIIETIKKYKKLVHVREFYNSPNVMAAIIQKHPQEIAKMSFTMFAYPQILEVMPYTSINLLNKIKCLYDILKPNIPIHIICNICLIVAFHS